MSHILIIDDDPKICLVLAGLMEELNHTFATARSLEQGRSLFRENAFDLVLLDLDLQDGNGLDLIPEITDSANGPEVIIITGTGDADGAELAFNYGAWDYVQKPFLLDEVILPITRALQYRREKQARYGTPSLKRDQIIGDSLVMRKSMKEVAAAARTDVSVLITGETGTGKELFARAVHNNSARSEKPFVAVDCGALPDTLLESALFGHEKGAFTGADRSREGLLVQAHQGTLMLDEVGDLPLEAQKSLLRTLQERCVRPVGSGREIPVDIRLVAATHLDLDQMVRHKLFRQDFLFRIRAMEIKLPPLRERGTDINKIAMEKIQSLSGNYRIGLKAVSDELLNALSAHDWPGNVRELVNVIEYVLASAENDPTLFPKHLPPAFRTSGLKFEVDAGAAAEKNTLLRGELPALAVFKNRMEKDYLKALLRKSGGDRRRACTISGISQSRLYGLLAKHGLPCFGKL